MPPTIFGLSQAVFLLWTSAFFYVLAILLLWKSFFRERTELMAAFFAFLSGMAFFHMFLGAGFYFDNLLLIHIGSLAALTGSAYTLKFPLAVLSGPGRKSGFYFALLAGWLIVAWMLIFPHSTDTMFSLVLGYMILATGGSGFYIIWKSREVKESWSKVKSIGGGTGLLTCCLAADLMVLFGGVTILGEVLMSLAPIILLFAVLLGRYLQKREEKILSGARA